MIGFVLFDDGPDHASRGRDEPYLRRMDTSSSGYSVMTVDWPDISNRLRQRMFLQAIMSSLRTI